jgi:hypothetical protein
MNTYIKYCPNVFIAKCSEPKHKGDIITLITKYGKEHECIVFNLVSRQKDLSYCYSIVRADGYNVQERAKAKAERYSSWSDSAQLKSNESYKKSDLSEKTTGIVFGQPILVGHHSEKKHRKTIERADNAMRKSIELRDKAGSHQSKAEYWESKASEINLSMPESIEYYEFELERAKMSKELIQAQKPNKRAHSFSLPYATKKVKEMQKRFDTAQKLWGE